MSSDNTRNLVRLLQLASPALPVGAFSYSQGLEAAADAGIVHDRDSALAWINDLLTYSLGSMDAPVLLRMIDAWRGHDYACAAAWNDVLLASRETAELRAETVQMGFSMARLLKDLPEIDQHALKCLNEFAELSFPAAFACACAAWELAPEDALSAYLWSWAENQVMAALKSVPLGQTDGQRMLVAIGDRLSAVVERAATLSDEDIGAFTPRLAILSSRHETQYSRLFRS
jgi:urease accessory protein